MKKTIITTVVVATLSITSVSFAGNIETAERYSAPLEQQQTIGDMNVSAVKMGQEIASSELSFGLGSNAEIQELGRTIIIKYRRNGSIRKIIIRD